MNKFIEIITIVEGRTEEIFIKKILGEYLSHKNIYMIPIQISKPGQKGGDVKFSRAIKDITIHMKQRQDTYISLLIDYYGLKNDWPGFNEAQQETVPSNIASIINKATHKAVNDKLSGYGSASRFIPNIEMHEFEALLFSDASCLATALQVPQSAIDNVINQFGDPEKIDDSPLTAPSKRLENFYPRYKKTSTGIVIAQNIGIEKIRSKCKIFNNWLIRLEALIKTNV
ncbi:MAG: DUF4276 family protein [Spirochaetales bacterium]|nr:DUF4276 family protein [Spirochaetales bacterium]